MALRARARERNLVEFVVEVRSQSEADAIVGVLGLSPLP
jgi:hypothetical protein